MIASGGDMTPEGHCATPVQMAYLVENGKLVGRLPELNISGNFFELLGKDYLGTVHGTPQLKSMLSAVTMDVNKGYAAVAFPFYTIRKKHRGASAKLLRLHGVLVFKTSAASSGGGRC